METYFPSFSSEKALFLLPFLHAFFLYVTAAAGRAYFGEYQLPRLPFTLTQFHSFPPILPPGPPDPPRNCSLANQTQDSLQIDCVQGFSSGLRQEFHMEVWVPTQQHYSYCRNMD